MSAKSEFWKSYWNILGDPFSGEPLGYSEDGTDRLMIKTEPVSKIDIIINEIELPTLRKRYFIIGQRGMGKSTLMNYMVRELMKSPSKATLPIFVNTVTEAGELEKLRLDFVEATIESFLISVLEDMKRFGISNQKMTEKFDQLRQKYFEQKGQGKIDRRTAENFLYHLLTIAKEFGVHHFVILYDELDKIDNYDLVLAFLRKSQYLLENLKKYDALVLMAGIPDWIKLLTTDEYGGVKGEVIPLNPWYPGDAKNLIEMRLKYSTYGKFIDPFTNEAVTTLVKRAEGRPRKILELAKAMLIWGANQDNKCFDQSFCEKTFWRNGSEARFFDALASEETIRKGTEALVQTYDPEKDNPTLYFLLTQIFKVQKIYDLPFTEIRKRYGLDMDESTYRVSLGRLVAMKAIVPRKAGDSSFFSLSPDLRLLFEYVTQSLGEPLDYLPYVIRSKKAELVVTPEFSLRQEVTKLLADKPVKSFRVEEIARTILENPDARTRAHQYYSVRSPRLREQDLSTSIRIGIRPVLKKLVEEGYVLKQTKGRIVIYRWFPKYVDITKFEGLPVDERVVKDLEAAWQNFNNGLFDPAVSTCRSAVEGALRVLYETATKERCPKNTAIDDLNQMLLERKVTNRGIFSLILGFIQQTNPIVHRDVTNVAEGVAEALLRLAQSIVREIFVIRKSLHS